ncbi:hypothetical protein [Pseudoalteromonas sp. 5-MNA-CIBAN-0065]|uniref:hypothetical protein n=2 Tax=Pseudoalteromonas TaxID=53246 RepID=UPI003320DFB8
MTKQEALQRKESEFLKIIMIIALSVLLGVGSTFGYFFEFSPSREFKTWVDTATIFTGVATPILSTVSVFLLYFVWKDNRRELAATKKALTEQSDTQNFRVIKDAVFEIAYQAKLRLQNDVEILETDNRIEFVNLDQGTRNVIDDYYLENMKTIPFEEFLFSYFVFTKVKPIEKNKKNLQHIDMLYSEETFYFIDKIKSIAMFMMKIKSIEYKSILEITLFSKLTIFSWLMFTEIAFHLYKTAKEEERKYSELVFLEIAGLTCRQMKEVYWLDSLSEQVLSELKERKLL